MGGEAEARLSILVAERTALNFLQQLSGIATLTGKFVSAIAGNAQASVTFKPPVAAGASAITGYTATCRFGRSSPSPSSMTP